MMVSDPYAHREASVSVSRLPFAAHDRAPVKSFRHEAFLYSGIEHFLAGTTAFVGNALDDGEAVLAAVAEPHASLLRQALGDDAERIEFLDVGRVGRNPARLIPAWQDWVDRNAFARGFRGIGEPIRMGRTSSETAECRHHEQLVNTAFDDGPAWWLLCPYDVAALPAPMIEHAYASHPAVVADDTTTCSPAYRRPEPGSPAVATEPLEEPPGRIHEIGFEMGSLGDLRDWVEKFAEPVLGRQRTADAVLVVSELAANSIKYGGGAGILRLWRDGRALVCEVRDEGVITDPLIGRRRPIITVRGKAGLWIVNQVCDLVQIRSAPERGTVVRARLADADAA